MLSPSLHQVLGLLLLNTFVRALDVKIPVQAPSSASNIAQDHVSLSIEQDRWIEWIGSTSRNEFFFNTLDNLDRLTGAPPRIRIGGYTADTSNPSTAVKFYDAYVDNTTVSSTLPYPAAFGVALGPEFYPTVRFLPKNTKVVTGVNYGANDDLRASIHIATITNAFLTPEAVAQGVTLEAIELGSDPDRYGKDGNYFRSWDPKWSDTSAKYVLEWPNWVKNMKEVLLSGWQTPPVDTLFWTGSISTLGPRTESWTAKYLLSHNLVNDNVYKGVKTFSQHHYSGSACKGTTKDLQDLLSKSRIREGLNTFKEDIAAVKAKGLQYVLGEANSFSCHGAAGVSNVAGAAIWALDYVLYASQLGIDRVYFHNGLGYKFNLIQPKALTRSPLDNSVLSSPLAPHVQPIYYAAIIAAEAIGNSGQTRVVEIATSDSFVSGYAFYNGDKLAKALFINSKPYFTNGDRSPTRVNVAFEGTTGFASVKRLYIPSTDATSGLTWGGLTYETADARPTGIRRVERFDSASGLDVHPTEVALISFDN